MTVFRYWGMRLPAETPWKGIETSKEMREPAMLTAVAVAFSLIVLAPFIGRWRANVWLKANVPAEESAADRIPETA